MPTKRFLIILTIVALVLRLVAIVVMDTKGSVLANGWENPSAMEPYQMAKSLIESGGFYLNEVEGKPIPTGNQPPFFPLYLAAILKLIPNEQIAFIFVQIVNAIVGSLVPWLSYLVGKRFFGELTGRWAGILTCASPLIVYMPVEPHSITFGLVITLSLTLLYSKLFFDDERSLKDYALSGGLTGLCVLVRSELAVLGPILFLLIVLKNPVRTSWKPALFFTLCASLFVGPWIVRNAIVLGKPSLSTTMFLNLYRGNHAGATGGSYLDNGKISWEVPDGYDAPDLAIWSQDYELKLEKEYKKLLSQDFEGDSGILARVVPRKLFYFWAGDLTHPKGKQLPSLIMHLLASATAFMGFYFALRNRVKSWPVWMWILIYQLIVLAFFALPRYRLNVEPFILIFSAYGLVCLAMLLWPNRVKELESDGSLA